MTAPQPDSKQTLADIAGVLGSDASLHQAQLSVFRSAPPAAELADMLAGLPHDAEGWLTLPEAVLVLEQGLWSVVGLRHTPHAPLNTADCARVLAAEFALDAHSSLHLRRVGEALNAYRFTERPDTARPGETPQAERVPTLVQDLSFVSTERVNGSDRMRYRWFARHGDARGTPALASWEPWLARFTGWKDQT